MPPDSSWTQIISERIKFMCSIRSALNRNDTLMRFIDINIAADAISDAQQAGTLCRHTAPNGENYFSGLTIDGEEVAIMDIGNDHYIVF
ncbi:hypothetical protein [Kozakia baliensis]|uniref:hypothetical protein n=1 Tax=Kozakia baliensis TaxID=153496 RepID=UPI00124721C1|nr:hypothetical protein [Kozakia baliensis]